MKKYLYICIYVSILCILLNIYCEQVSSLISCLMFRIDGVSIEIYRAAIGLFDCYKLLSLCFSTPFAYFWTLIVCLHLGILLLALFFLTCSDVEIKPGPERSVSLFLTCSDVEIKPGPERSVSLKLGHLNARSLNMVHKFEEIASIILNEDLKIFALSETWLNSFIPRDLFHIPGYFPSFRLDRSDGRRAGGVGLYVLF